MIEEYRRKVLTLLNSRYIYGRVPVLHSIIFFIEMVLAAGLIARYNAYYSQRPVLTTMVTNALLGGIADTTAQVISAFRTRALSLPQHSRQQAFVASDGIELDDVNEKPARLTPELSPITRGPAPFDFERLTRFMAYGFLMSPLQFVWFGRLTKWFPITSKTGGMSQALKRVALDQLMFAPFGLCCFFTFMTVAEGGGKRALVKKFQDVYLPTLRANYVLWPAVQVLNFRVMPLQFQIPFVSSIGIAWTAYLSLTNSAEDDAIATS